MSIHDNSSFKSPFIQHDECMGCFCAEAFEEFLCLDIFQFDIWYYSYIVALVHCTIPDMQLHISL